ncbi:MAG TPA: transglycosylase domain-containing protein [Acidimicrobiales bacterium]|nr:transglycosylase domain-containing protein [Acidimicrobiales bacterium]
METRSKNASPSFFIHVRPTRHVTVSLLVSAVIALIVSGIYVPVVSSTIIVGAANLDAMVTDLPPLVIPSLPQGSTLLAADGSVLATFTSENRVPVKLSAVAPVVVKVLLSSEDRTFYTNNGIDPRGIVRALLANIEGRPIQGGSTITQQYVKNILELQGGPAVTLDTIQRKINEIVYARQLTRELTKNQILEGYLNTVYFGAQAYGIEAAARRYYSVHASQLDLQQSAMLVALVEAPTTYDPLTNPTLARVLRDQVLHVTYLNHQITLAQERAAAASPLDLKPSLPTTGCQASKVPYFCDLVSNELTTLPALGATVAQRVATLQRGGLVIHSSLVPSQQAAAETAAVSIVGVTNRVGDAIVVETPGTGAITAMAQNRVYGLDTTKNETTLNYANSSSPVGSTFKAFTLSAALSAGIPLTTILPAGSQYHSTVFDNPPGGYFTNADPSSATNLSIAQATDGSVNTAFVQLEEKVGVLAIAKTARLMGADTLPLSGPDAVTAKEGSLTLGARGFSPIQMAGAYATLAAHGLHCAPYAVTSVTLANGTSLNVSPQCTQVISPAVADTVTSLLAGVITSGTGTGAAVAGHTLAGKTGTTSNFGSAWFDGYTATTAMAVWMGDPRGVTYPLYNVAGVPVVYGGTLPAEMFKMAMTSILQGQPNVAIAPPTEIYLAKSSAVVPDVADLSVQNARALLQTLGLVVTGARNGVAGTTNPPAGTPVSPGDAVTLNAYSGPPS